MESDTSILNLYFFINNVRISLYFVLFSYIELFISFFINHIDL